MRPHVLIVTAEDSPDPRYRIECPGNDDGGCTVWFPCEPCAGLDYWDDDPGTGEQIESTEVAHGQPHLWLDGEWGTPASGCFIADHGDLGSAAADLDLPPGRWLVQIDWDADPNDRTALALKEAYQ